MKQESESFDANERRGERTRVNQLARGISPNCEKRAAVLARHTCGEPGDSMGQTLFWCAACPGQSGSRSLRPRTYSSLREIKRQKRAIFQRRDFFEKDGALHLTELNSPHLVSTRGTWMLLLTRWRTGTLALARVAYSARSSIERAGVSCLCGLNLRFLHFVADLVFHRFCRPLRPERCCIWSMDRWMADTLYSMTRPHRLSSHQCWAAGAGQTRGAHDRRSKSSSSAHDH